MKNKLFLTILMLAFIFAGCNLEVKHPYQLTIHLAGENTSTRGICEGHSMTTPKDAQEIIITVRSAQLTPKTYSKRDGQIKVENNSITINNADFGNSVDIEIQIMSSVANYIGKLHGVTIEPYKANNITIPIEEIKPHIIMWGGTNIYAVPDVNNRSLVLEKGITASSDLKTLTTDKHGRGFYVEGSALKSVDNAVNTGSITVIFNFWIDPFTNTLYTKKNEVGGSPVIYKHKIDWTKVQTGANITTKISANTDSMAFSKEYIVTTTTTSSQTETSLYLYDKNLKKLNKNENVTKLDNTTIHDMKIVGDKLYILVEPKNTPKFHIKVFSILTLNYVNDIINNLLTQPIKFVGQRDNLLYIADRGSKTPATTIPPRLCILNTSTNELDFIDAKEFDSNINFN